jgi:DNA-binding transcriptional ArsR family regulator
MATKGTIVKDAEVQAIAAVQKIMDALAEPARARVMRFLAERYDAARPGAES